MSCVWKWIYPKNKNKETSAALPVVDFLLDGPCSQQSVDRDLLLLADPPCTFPRLWPTQYTFKQMIKVQTKAVNTIRIIGGYWPKGKNLLFQNRLFHFTNKAAKLTKRTYNRLRKSFIWITVFCVCVCAHVCLTCVSVLGFQSGS